MFLDGGVQVHETAGCQELPNGCFVVAYNRSFYGDTEYLCQHNMEENGIYARLDS